MLADKRSRPSASRMQARGQGEGQLVGVRLPVRAGVAVVAEQLAPAEGERAGVEDRQVVLVAVRRVQVEQARLERVQVRAAVDGGRAVEVQAGVDAADRQAARRRARDALSRSRSRASTW